MNKEEINTRIDVLERTIEIVRERISDLKAQKPKAEKLSHGDYGKYEKSGGFWWVWERNGILELFGRKSGGGTKAQAAQIAYPDMIRMGNIIDDLEALGKPPTDVFLKAKANGYIVRVERSNNNQAIIFLSAGATDGAHLNLDEAIKVRNALSQRIMEATAKAIESAGGEKE